jgi:hypothetical protein
MNLNSIFLLHFYFKFKKEKKTNREKRKRKNVVEEKKREREKRTRRLEACMSCLSIMFILLLDNQCRKLIVAIYCFESFSVIITGNETQASSRPLPSIK